MAAMAGMGGFAAGLAQGQQTAFAQEQKQEMMNMAMQESSMRLRKESLEVKQAEMMAAANQEAAKKIKALNEGGAGPGAQPYDQAMQLARIQDIYASAASDAGLGEQAAEYSKRALELRESAFKIRTAQTDQIVENARRYEVDVAQIDPHDPNAQAKWHQLQLRHNAEQPDNPSRFNGTEQFTPQFKENLLHDIENVKRAGLNAKDAALYDQRETKIGQASIDLAIKEERLERLMQQADAAKKAGADNIPVVNGFLAELGARGLVLGKGVRGAAAQQALGAAFIARHPELTTDEERVNYVAGNQEAVKAEMAEAAMVGRREGNIGPAMVALNKPGGLFEQLGETARNVNFNDSKVQTQSRLFMQKHIKADPDIQEYLTTLRDTRMDVASVLQRSGTMTEGAAERAAEMLPDPSSKEEMDRSIWRSRQLMQQVADGNTLVKAALKAHKPIDKVMELAGVEDLPEKREMKKPPPARTPTPGGPSDVRKQADAILGGG